MAELAISDKGTRRKYPLATMQVGDWFVLPQSVDIANFRTHLYRMRKKLKRNFLTLARVDGLLVQRTS